MIRALESRWGLGRVFRSLLCVSGLVALLATGGCSGEPTGASDGGSDATQQSDAAPAHVGPIAKLFVHDPITDKRQTTRVELPHLTDTQGRLTGKFANAFNCVNKQGGDTFKVNFGTIEVSGRMCVVEKTSRAGRDGSYLHIKPGKDTDGSDAFAELMMYYHVTKMHDFFAEKLGVKHMNKPLRAIANVQAYVDLFNRWFGIVNAAFVPKASGNLFKTFGVDLNKGQDALIFIQGDDVDTAYDASVIYHEYSHAVIGAALSGNAYDKYGIDPTPGALNEGLADYFSASHLDAPYIGRYLSKVTKPRDLSRDLRCPEHIVGEVHNDGEIVGGATWALRTLLGTKIADQAILDAVLSFTKSTNFERGARAILDEVKKRAPAKYAAAEQLFKQRGLLGCTRVKAHSDFDLTSSKKLAPRIPAGSSLFANGTPAYLQRRVKLASTTKQVTIEWLSRGASGLFGLSGSAPDLRVAVRAGSDPITWDHSKSPATSTAHAIFAGKAQSPSGRKLVLSGSCLARGALVFQFVNRSTAMGELKRLKVSQSDTVSKDATSFETCK